MAERAATAIFEDQRLRLDNARFNFEQHKELFTKAEQRRFDVMWSDRNRKLDAAERDKKAINELAIDALANGASKEVAARMQSANSIDEAISIGGEFIGRLDRAFKQAQINKLNAELAELVDKTDDVKGLLSNYEVGSDAYNRLLILNSAKFDKELDQSQREKIEQSLSALSSLESLTGLLMQGKDGLTLSGPLTGRARDLMTAFGGDATAASINAIIQGMIPTVARGIFGEVGVLTDADIENYKKTVPNLKGSEAQNKLISLVMYDVLSRSVANTLTVGARAGQNTSRFLDVYDNVRSRVEVQKSALGITGLEGLSDDEFLGGGATVTTESFFTNLNSKLTP
jgi:hypothetical protein